MARCASTDCRGWRPSLLADRGRAGVVLDGAWYCSQSCVERAAARTLEAAGRPGRGVAGPVPIPPLKLGMLLVHQGALTPVQLDAALAAQPASGLRLGELLRRERTVGRLALLQALATQSSAPYLPRLDASVVRHAPAALGPNAVRALGLIPFEVDAARQRVKVACAAPVPRLALRALAELTGWVADPFVVDDEQMPILHRAYAAGLAERHRAGELGRPTSIRIAAAHIAQVAAQKQGTRLRHVQCDPFLWIRLEGGQDPDDVIVRAGSKAQEQPWQAEHTSH
jgi:hypothetical protein